MKKIITTTYMVIIVLIAMSTRSLYATSFTAVASGDWSSSATWGISAPGFTITNDQITIPIGITVTLDNNATFGGALSALNVNGTLASGSTTSLTMNMGSIGGAGTISVSEVILNASSSLTFTGTFAVKAMTTGLANLLTTAHIKVSETMTLSSGILSLQSGSLFEMDSNATILMAGGSIILNGGITGLGKPYKVTYTSSCNMGAEVTGSGLAGIKVNITQGSGVTLQSDLLVTGALDLESGEIVLNGHHLTLNGDFAAGGTGTIHSTTSSNISITKNASLTGIIRFSENGNTVNNLTLNIGEAGGYLMLGSDLKVNGTINLMGGCLHTGSFNLDLGTTGTITGAGNTSYIRTGSGGRLSIYVIEGNSVETNYPVGNANLFTPVYIKLSSGSQGRTLGIGVDGDVLAQGSAGTSISTTQSIVKNTWHVFSQNTVDLDMSLKVIWSASAEVNAFDRTQAYISQYVGGRWDVSAKAAATAEAGGMFSLQREHINSAGPLAVFDKNATGVPEINSSAFQFILFPNPVNNEIHVKKLDHSPQQVRIDILNMLGEQISTYTLEGDEEIIPLTQLAGGNYFVRLYNSETSVLKKIIKL